MFKKIRILILLYVLLLVAGGTWLTRERTTDWDTSLWMVIHPIAADDSEPARRFVASLTSEDFESIEQFMAREANRYGLSIRRPVVARLGAALEEAPPAPPRSRNPLAVIWWSLNLRYWSWQVGREHDDPPADIRMYVVFHDPDSTARVSDSLGLQKGMIGVVHGFASRGAVSRNALVIAHEMLHTVGATDKYDPTTNLPIHPIGYAEPNRTPLYPQRRAELMGGRIPLSATRARGPAGLTQAVIGPATALEIRWR